MIERMSHSAARCLVMATCLCSAGAHAQVFPFRLYSGLHLSKSDYAAIRQASGKLLTTDGARTGSTESWSGPTSGNSGTLTVQQALRKKGYDCRAVEAEVTYKSGASGSRLLDICQVPGAGWKIVS